MIYDLELRVRCNCRAPQSDAIRSLWWRSGSVMRESRWSERETTNYCTWPGPGANVPLALGSPLKA